VSISTSNTTFFRSRFPAENVYALFHGLHSVHYKTIITIQTKEYTQFY